MDTVTRWTVDQLYGLLTRSHLTCFPEKKALYSFLFHGLFRNNDEINLRQVDPQQRTTVAHFREFVDYFSTQGFHFIRPEDLHETLPLDKNCVLITFDDGYFNNHLALSVLEEYAVPATFFISANHVQENKCFWWDVVYRERTKRGTASHQLQDEYSFLKKMRNEEIESYLAKTFGSKALQPLGDIDRPMKPEELNVFSHHSWVAIGNHTFNHAILTNYTAEGIKTEIAASQKYLFRITGKTPTIIAYPNGNYSEEVITAAKEAGLVAGVTVKPHKNYFPLKTEEDSLFKISRFTVWGNENVSRQCQFFRTEIHSERIRRRFNAWTKTLAHQQ